MTKPSMELSSLLPLSSNVLTAGHAALNQDKRRCMGCLLPAHIAMVLGLNRLKITGYAKNPGLSFVLQAELWGLYEGLRLAWNHCVANLEVQSDNSQAVKLINSSDAAVSSLSLIRAIASLRNRQWETRVRWIPRSKNCVGDSLSKMAPFGLSDATYFDTPSSGVAHLVEREAH
ncbi:hypothetical protein F3Y22_tig00110299pilonHSYRG00185 [Hibiscus syriacus]|uniref:RNase H type-1 domain-containing protein n=1 Tax=Hibiscus syriacus TaxID=106335 RepID=A0A6A3B8P8_HIBSY|nr:hypothetical protein F3Y22_tig00110299pilonHSYRG00185 [Hibiscus syriacus]